jgi:hypothetical protein
MKRKPRSRRQLLVMLVGIAIVLAVVVGIQRAGGSASPSPAEPQKAAEPKTKQAKLTAVRGASGAGTASLAGGRLRLRASGLPDPKGGTYTVWLYNSLIDSKPIGTGRGTTVDLNAKLPADAKSFKYVDVSLEPADGNPNHSGESVVRVPLAELGLN